MSAGRLLCLTAVAALAACGAPTYVDAGKPDHGSLGVNEVVFQVHDAYKAAPPDCVAVLPLAAKTPARPEAGADDLAKVRLSLYAHLAVQSKRSVRLDRIDRVLAEVRGDRKALGERLNCGAVLEGLVTEYGSGYFGVYSRVAVGVELRMLRTADGTVLWEGRHTAASHGGSVPLDPVGVAMSLADAASNVRDEQILRVTDDLARRLVSTIPDNAVAALDDPLPEQRPSHTASPVVGAAEAFLAGLDGKPPGDRQQALRKALEEHRFPGADGERLGALLLSERPRDAAAYLAVADWRLAEGDHPGAVTAAEQSAALDPRQHRAHFIKGRAQLLDHDAAGAEQSFLKAIALDRDNVLYLDALGAASSQRGDTERALAAYRLAISIDPADGFAWYNSAVIVYNAGDRENAAKAFYSAGLCYLKAGDYARAERALADLKDLANAGVPDQAMVQEIETALADLGKK